MSTDVVVAGVDPAWFGPGQLVVDLVYEPAMTPFLIEAERAGATVRSGLGMLVHQAGRQIRLWTGMEPPLAVMWDAVRDR
jgi:shikimate dehydrogenase